MTWGPIAIGTCSWADHRDFYPPEYDRRARQRDKLSYYAQFFPIVEIDTSFYGIPTPQTVVGWVDRTPESFRFNIKAYRSLTGHERELGRSRPPTKQEEGDFLEALKPLRDSGKLGAVHYQFPPWFTRTARARNALLDARERHPNDILAVEFRHRSWFDGGAWPETEQLLRELDAVFVGVDAPQIGSGTAPPVLAVTSPRLAIVRFHGRNRRAWYIKNSASSADRFDYLYSRRELSQWVPTIRAVSATGTPLHLLLNNNRGNQGVVNAFDLAQLLDVLLPSPAPPPILATMRERDALHHDPPLDY